MKYQIRQGVFETNSSSVHSITICSKDEWDAFERGEMMYNKRKCQLIPSEEGNAFNADTIERYKRRGFGEPNSNDLDCITFDEYCKYNSCYDYEMFRHEKNINGVDVIAFGYYGSDY